MEVEICICKESVEKSCLFNIYICAAWWCSPLTISRMKYILRINVKFLWKVKMIPTEFIRTKNLCAIINHRQIYSLKIRNADFCKKGKSTAKFKITKWFISTLIHLPASIKSSAINRRKWIGNEDKLSYVSCTNFSRKTSSGKVANPSRHKNRGEIVLQRYALWGVLYGCVPGRFFPGTQACKVPLEFLSSG